jgi:hypothetical protein
MKHPLTARGGRHIARGTITALLGLAALGAGCKKETPKEVSPAPAVATPAPAAPKAKPAAAAPKVAAKPLQWDAPAEWKVGPKNPFRLATYEIPGAKGAKGAELSVSIAGGGVDANITRWVGEFSAYDPKTLVRSDRTVNDMQQTILEIPKGTFSGGMQSSTASPNSGLLAAIVVTPAGAEHFFKITGPSATVKAARAPFYKLLDSIRLEGATATPPSAASPTAPAKSEPAPAKPATGAAAVTQPASVTPDVTPEATPAAPAAPKPTPTATPEGAPDKK